MPGEDWALVVHNAAVDCVQYSLVRSRDGSGRRPSLLPLQPLVSVESQGPCRDEPYLYLVRRVHPQRP